MIIKKNFVPLYCQSFVKFVPLWDQALSLVEHLPPR